MKMVGNQTAKPYIPLIESDFTNLTTDSSNYFFTNIKELKRAENVLILYRKTDENIVISVHAII